MYNVLCIKTGNKNVFNETVTRKGQLYSQTHTHTHTHITCGVMIHQNTIDTEHNAKHRYCVFIVLQN